MAKSLEHSTTRVEVNRGADPRRNGHPERRQRARTNVHWGVVLLRNGGLEAVETVTQDLSVGGFYCLSTTAFVPGESVICLLKLPTHNPGERESQGHLEGRAKVLRVDAVGADGFGIACRIEDYRFARP